MPSPAKKRPPAAAPNEAALWRAVGAGWRYTFGTISWLGDTIFPGRLLGGDHYNPYTNTVNIFSDAPAIGLHESGHAKDWARRKYKGTYAAIYGLPVVPLWHEAVASRLEAPRAGS